MKSKIMGGKKEDVELRKGKRKSHLKKIEIISRKESTRKKLWGNVVEEIGTKKEEVELRRGKRKSNLMEKFKSGRI